MDKDVVCSGRAVLGPYGLSVLQRRGQRSLSRGVAGCCCTSPGRHSSDALAWQVLAVFHESAVYPVNLANVVKAAAIISACELARGSNDPLYWFFVVTACIETSVSIGILARLWLTAIRTLPPSTARSEYAVLGAWLGAFSAWQFVFLGLLCMVSTGPAGAPLA